MMSTHARHARRSLILAWLASLAPPGDTAPTRPMRLRPGACCRYAAANETAATSLTDSPMTAVVRPASALRSDRCPHGAA
jgi:hypothetical protein